MGTIVSKKISTQNSVGVINPRKTSVIHNNHPYVTAAEETYIESIINEGNKPMKGGRNDITQADEEDMLTKQFLSMSRRKYGVASRPSNISFTNNARSLVVKQQGQQDELLTKQQGLPNRQQQMVTRQHGLVARRHGVVEHTPANLHSHCGHGSLPGSLPCVEDVTNSLCQPHTFDGANGVAKGGLGTRWLDVSTNVNRHLSDLIIEEVIVEESFDSFL